MTIFSTKYLVKSEKKSTLFRHVCIIFHNRRFFNISENKNQNRYMPADNVVLFIFVWCFKKESFHIILKMF